MEKTREEEIKKIHLNMEENRRILEEIQVYTYTYIENFITEVAKSQKELAKLTKHLEKIEEEEKPGWTGVRVKTLNNKLKHMGKNIGLNLQ